jgi:trimeric autotransporter adhesin
VRLFVTRSVRRYVGLAFLLFFTVPFGLSVIGCGHHSAPPVYCNTNLNSGPVVGQAFAITLAPNLATIGESLNYGQIAPGLSATTQDCHGNSVSVSKYTYATTSMTIADINPSTGSVCGGTWNRQTGSGIPDFTICNAPATTPSSNIAYITASANGVTSNAIAVFVHPVVTAVQLSPAQSTTGAGCSATDPTSDCCPTNVTTTPEPPAPSYDGTSCISQNDRVELAAKAYAGGFTDPAHNITCQVGHLTFAAQGSANVVTIDANGFATANQPGSSTITATVSNSTTASNAGFFSTCPPASIVLTAVGQTGSNINVGLNNSQPLNATVYDTNKNQITGISLTYNSTTPQTIAASSGSVLPSFPGSANITAVCEPSACNPSPLSQVGYLGNGKPLTSNAITVNTAGTSGTVLYMASTSSQYVVPYDFTLNQQGAPIKLPFVPNSMVMTQDGTAIYFGSPQGLMSITTSGNSASAANQLIPGTVLAVSPDGTTQVVTDPTRQTVSLVSTGAVTTSYGNVVGTSAAWSPDSQTVYITTTSNTLLTHNAFNNWQVATTNPIYTDVAVTVPHIGAYFAAGQSGTEGRSYCATTTIQTPGSDGNPPTTANEYYPLAGTIAAPTDQIAATTDGNHILGAAVANGAATLQDISVVLPVTTPCPMPSNPPPVFQNTNVAVPLSQITATQIDGVVPASNSVLAFVTYTGSSGMLPEYIIPAAGATGTVTYLQLGNGATTATAPLAGVFSTDNLNLYVGASDGQVHLLTINGTSATERGVLQPNLPLATGSGNAPVNLIAQHPKKLQS